MKNVLNKSAGLKRTDFEDPEQFAKQAKLAIALQELTSDDNQTALREQMNDLAVQYERLRAAMPASNERTIALNEIVTQMRTLARVCASFWAGFAGSHSPGKRLAAIVIAQMDPGPQFVHWLRDRFGVETPFLLYQCALALWRIAEVACDDQISAVLTAVRGALDQLHSMPGIQPDRRTVQALESIRDGRYSRGFVVS